VEQYPHHPKWKDHIMRRLVVGTHNRKKLHELRDLLGDLPLELADMSAYPDISDVEETGDTFEANARLKAIAYAKATNQWVLAEDSGLCVPALGGRPGIYSARYAGTHNDDAANNARIITELKLLPEEKRGAYYICTAALSDPTGEVVAVSEGRCHGVMLTSPRGDGGFGYDPLFMVPEFHQTFGELSLRVKQALSHRARAVTKLRSKLRQLAQEASS